MSDLEFWIATLSFGAIIFLGISNLIEAKVRLWTFPWLMSWWWPFRKPSAAALVSAYMDMDQLCTQWKVDLGKYKPCLYSDQIKTRVVYDDIWGYYSMTIEHEKFHLNLWDRYLIRKSFRAWTKRFKTIQKAKANQRLSEKALAITQQIRDSGALNVPAVLKLQLEEYR